MNYITKSSPRQFYRRRYDAFLIQKESAFADAHRLCRVLQIRRSYDMIFAKEGIHLRFMESYKRLERLCGDMLQCDRPVLTYIEEMRRNPRGVYYVEGWEADQKRLDHYRWVRNKITHDPNCTEANMCSDEDAVWLENFYMRIMHQEDPLALYRKATQPHLSKKSAPITPCIKTGQASNRGLYLAAGLLVLGLVAVVAGALLMLL